MFAAMDQTLPADMPITLVIKAPNQRMADQTVDCMLGWTIRKLKEHLEVVYPSRPKHNEQRLIYSGKLLQDHLTLKEILRQYDENEQVTRHTVHLVCSKSSDSCNISAPKGQGEQKTTSSRESTPSPAMNNNSNTQTSATASTQQQSSPDGLRYRGSAATGTSPAVSMQQTSHSGMYPTAYGVYTSVPSSMASPANYTPDQYAWLMQQQQQAYSQYMMQYMQHYQSMYYPWQPYNAQVGTPSTYSQQPVPNPAEQQQPQPEQAAARPNNNEDDMPRMNAQGGVDQDDENDLEPRDWLHHVYFIMRFLTFMGFLFFHSSPTRFVLVSSGSIAIYFLQKIRRHMQRIQQAQEQERQQQEAERQRQQTEEQQQDNAGEGASDVNNTEVNNAGQQEEEQRQQQSAAAGGDQEARTEADSTPTQAQNENLPQDQEQGSWLIRSFVFVCMTIQAFFTSLLPTPPELLEAN